MVDTEEVLQSHRNKLKEDKERLMRPYRVGILPTDEGRASANEERRKLRRDEYLKYIQKENQRSQSVAELRKELADERKKELHSYRDKSWADEERELMKWLRDKGNVKSEPDPRSLSAPVPGGWSLGAKEETAEERRERQAKYRLELMEQIKQQQEMKNGPRDPLKKRNNNIPPHSPETRDSRRTRDREHSYREPSNRESSYREPSNREPSYRELSGRDRSHKELRHREVSPPMDEYRFRPGDRHEYRSRYSPPDSAYYRHRNYPPSYPSHAHYPSPAPYYYPPYPHYPPMAGGPYNHPPPLPPPFGYPPPHDLQYVPSAPRTSRRRSPDARHSPSPPPEVREDKKDSRIRESAKEPFKTILKKKEKEKRDRENFIKRMEDDTYDPWGRPGGGAPLTDASGNLVTERGLMRKSFDELSPRLSDEEKKRLQQEKQKEELMKQINEKEEQKMKEKLAKQLEDEKEENRIKQEMKYLHLQTEREREREKERVEMKVTDSSKVEEQDQFKDEGLSKQEIVEKKYREDLERKKMKKQLEQERLDRLADKMASSHVDDNNYQQYTPPTAPPPRSPPIPTLRNKPNTIQQEQPPIEESRPIPTPLIDNPAPSQAPPIYHTQCEPQAPPIYHTQCEPIVSPSPDVVRLPVEGEGAGLNNGMKQTLSLLKNQLIRNLAQSEHERINNRQNRNNNPPSLFHSDVRPTYDSHSVPQPHSHSTHSHSHRVPQPHSHSMQPHAHFTHSHLRQPHSCSTHSHNPVPMMKPVIPRGPAPPDAVNTFNRIKYGGPPTDSRLSFWRQYPEPPSTTDDLELQQEALLHHQRKERERISPHYDTQAPPPPRGPSRQSQVTINTIDIEGLAARNEERKRKLEAILQGRQNQQQQDRSALDGFMKTFNEREPDHVTTGGVASRDPSSVSLECDTVFQTLPSN
ncbi:PREDICTED: trichohyalin-like [Amphimedon queenslandica]|uniref:Centrosome and spindle pole-associated protein 1 C-terminal domain-containing protein n=1 Tax=Amphimedon queenslandica TaxID=400682 RepID=A0A1X7VD52_AMPQE|nr:PREDICTED: trichohyalin-like [Amphimedon queenslandica]|eukprot:XP_003384803.1 PREDICTED: trichohyalin-like [Amphimedon queenslandica]